MAAPSIQQTQTDTTLGTLEQTLTLTGVTAGRTILGLALASSSSRNYCWKSDQDDKFICGQIATNNRILSWGIAIDVAGGDTDVTMIESSGTSADVSEFAVFEIDPCHLSQFDDFVRNSNDTTNYSAQSAGIDVEADSLVISFGRHNADPSTITKDSNYTEVSGLSEWIIQYRETTSLLSGERPSWTTATSRYSAGVTLVLKDLSGGGGGDTNIFVIED